jgi:Ca-activated chloride channel homolog
MSQFSEQNTGRSSEDYYHFLGVDDDASPQEVRLAYRDLVRQYHPDSGHVGGTSLLFRRIQEAYEVLSDPDRRRQYDARLRQEGKRPPALLDVEVVLGPTHLPQLDDVQLLYTLVKITPVSARPLERTPLNLALVLDRSTSMKSDRLDAVRQATLSLVAQLEPEDLFSLVTFSDRAEVLIPAQHKPDMRTLRSVMSTIRASGGTEIHRGLVAGLAEATRVRSDRQINHVLMLTDGHTYGDTEKCLAAARAAARQNIGISGMGVGVDWNEDFLDHLASAGGGAVLYIEESDNIGAAFERRLRDLKDAWIPDLRVTMQYDPIANHKEIFCISPELKRLDGRDSEFSIGPLQRTDSLLLLVESIVSSHLGGRHRIMRMEFQGNVPVFGATALHQHAVRVEFQPASHTRTLVPPAIIEAARRVSLLRMQERVELDIAQGAIGAGAGRLRHLASRLLQDGQADLASKFELEAEHLVSTGVLSAAGTKRIRYGTRALALPPLGRM